MCVFSVLAGQSLRVDFVLGQGAFATVYQATNLMSSQKLILKVRTERCVSSTFYIMLYIISVM